MKNNLVIGVVAVAAVVGVVLVVSNKDKDTGESTSTPTPSVSASPTPNGSVSPTVSMIPVPSQTPAPTSTVTPSPTASPTPGPTTVGFSASTYSVNETDSMVTVTVTRTGSALGETRVSYDSEDGTAAGNADYLPVSGTFVFKSGVTSHTFDVEIRDDSQLEDNETIVLRLSGIQGAVAGRTSATISIVDDESQD